MIWTKTWIPILLLGLMAISWTGCIEDPDVPPCVDLDGDGYGNADFYLGGCLSEVPDCDDSNPEVSPSSIEICDDLDNDCDGRLGDDELDGDGDGVSACDGDCDNLNVNTYPGATEICDGFDNDCDDALPEDESDVDGDGHRACDTDCDDSNADINPDADEACNLIDDDCDGDNDEDFHDDVDDYTT